MSKQEDISRFRPKSSENEKVKVTLFPGLCKSCGECIVKCPVKCIDWDKNELGQLGEPAITIDIGKCIACETCEQICPDCAVQIEKKTAMKPLSDDTPI